MFNFSLNMVINLWHRGAAEVPKPDDYPKDSVAIDEDVWGAMDFALKSCFAQGASYAIAVKRGNRCGNGTEKCGNNDINVLSKQTHKIMGRWRYYKLTVE